MPTEIPAPPISPQIATTRGAQPPAVRSEDRDAALWRAAQSFEAVFIAEMMAHAGAASSGSSSAAGGGFAEETFRSLLSREWAEDLAERGGIGLADQIYRSVAGASSR
ncbi:MAG: rod-binding protein [Pseudomonadota bacterium]